jgi:hypothetical protein
MVMSKRCIPYTPRNRELKDTVFALIGAPHQKLPQQAVLLDALQRWETRTEPGQIREIMYPEYDSSTWQPIDLQEG